MHELVEELRNILQELHATTKYANDLAYRLTLDSLLKNVENVRNAWCGSWFGYQARVYYRNFETPPVGTHFDRRYGFEGRPFGELREKSRWSEYSYDQIRSVINEGIEDKDIVNVTEQTKEWIYEFQQKKEDVLNIIRIAQQSNSSYFDDLYDRTGQLDIETVDEIIASDRPAEMTKCDPIAEQQGIHTPPHIRVKAEVLWSIRTVEAIYELCNIAEKLIAQIERVRITATPSQITGTKIFIGHGHSPDWLELEKFLKERLKLEVDEFNSVPIGGVSNKERYATDA